MPPSDQTSIPPVSPSRLITVVETGYVPGVLRELTALTQVERGQCRSALADRRAAMDIRWEAPPGNEWQDERIAQLAAELGCQADPRAVAAWFDRPDNQLPMRRYGWYGRWLPQVARLWPAAWRTELVTLLAENLSAAERFDFVEHLVHDTGCPPPTSVAFLSRWMEDRRHDLERPAHLHGRPPGADFGERMRNDPFTPHLLPLYLRKLGVGGGPRHHAAFVDDLTALVDADVISCADLADRCFTSLLARGWEEDWSGALRRIAADPAVHAGTTRDRVAVFDRTVADLLGRDDGGYQRSLLDCFRALALTPAEQQSRIGDYLAMLAGDSVVAAFAQETLAGLDATGPCRPQLLTEASEIVLRRPEKKLIRAQLSWLNRAARRDPARAEQVVLAAAVTFEHPDPAMQELALDTVARHLPAAGDAVLPALRTAAELLDRTLSGRACELLGLPRDDIPDPSTDAPPGVRAPGPGEMLIVHGGCGLSEILPVAAAPEPVPEPIATVEEVAEEVGAVLAGDPSVVAFERALDGLVRHARLDPAGLAALLRPIVRAHAADEPAVADCVPADLREVAAAVTGGYPPARNMRHRRRYHDRGNRFSQPGELLAARIDEAAEAVRTGALAFLLATPTLATGALDAAVLVRRVATYERLGSDHGPYDLAQALLRVTPTTDERVLSEAAALRSDAGRRVADWLRAGGLQHQCSEPADWDRGGRYPWLPVTPALAPPGPLPPRAMDLLAPCEGRSAQKVPASGYWTAQLPHHRDELAARAYRTHAVRAKGAAQSSLHALVQCAGPAGYALHLALAQAMGISATEQPLDHLATVDAVLAAAAQGDLDPDLLGRQLSGLTRADELLVNRVATSLRAVAQAGAYATVYSILRAALPGLLADAPVRGAGALLALAVECAVHARATGEIAAVTTVAARKGSSQLVRNARALRDTLRRNESQAALGL